MIVQRLRVHEGGRDFTWKMHSVASFKLIQFQQKIKIA